VRSDASYLSANDPRVLVGAGAQAGAARVRVAWPDGSSERWEGVPLGRYTELVRGSGDAEGGS
jgi:hypothetical protein